jgi:hypothetical protein
VVRVFYRSGRVLITEHVFHAERLGRRVYPINELTDVHIVRYEPDDDPAPRHLLGVSALGAALLVIPMLSPASTVLAGVTAGVLVICAFSTIRRRGRVRWELVANCGRQAVVLFESESQTEFDQVCRALQRALEFHANI